MKLDKDIKSYSSEELLNLIDDPSFECNRDEFQIIYRELSKRGVSIALTEEEKKSLKKSKGAGTAIYTVFILVMLIRAMLLFVQGGPNIGIVYLTVVLGFLIFIITKASNK